MKIITCLLCTAVASTAIAADDASWMSKIRPDHPRLFFNVDTWPAVKARALGVEKAYYEKLLKDGLLRIRSHPVWRCQNRRGHDQSHGGDAHRFREGMGPAGRQMRLRMADDRQA